MARIRHLAIISDNRERLVEFYTKAFGMKRIEGNGPAIYLTDGYINLALNRKDRTKQGLYLFSSRDDRAFVPLCRNWGRIRVE
jgi:catechol 2,3-dioxygenase-like lactoylglutathione lyase family enzyme